MKKILSLKIVIFFCLQVNAQEPPITAEILRQTYMIATDTLKGTAFLIEYNNQEYLITAKHLFRQKLHNGDSTKISIYQENKIKSFYAKYYIHENNTIDVAVLKLRESIKVLPPFSIVGDVILGQDIYFLGYPAFNDNQFLTTGTIGVLPLVKKGIISGWVEENGYFLYFLDGHNNPGFSGGPAVCSDLLTHKPMIFGVISGYYYENKPLKNNEGKDEAFYIYENSGIIKCYSIRLAQKIIEDIK